MSTLYITELNAVGNPINGGNMQIAVLPAIAEQTLTVSGTSAQSSAFNDQTKYVRLHTDDIISVLFGTNPTATTSKLRMDANTTEYFAVPQAQSYKVAAITNT